ncbi:hypothetical protein MPTK1_5g14020 [Marchantia polymorpha subsp. ruderalis]|uniref:tRNA-binding domain-containing protein n=2 Tax=Marchantia polymorpha TaxID=3197 RepID=A0AAF6BI57_MARPO|nr:hypothetical protein MARPO_0032s0092 [Marchantia polymorpha]BBN11691.1 hypothetical protein Mp_5g14020 [Marchantia polymorpha subsp. ruderalis]|eukprot:PTQ41905.1 hypothetical protein MARPO_0032s0092 [Marchantia polymorpha]
MATMCGGVVVVVNCSLMSPVGCAGVRSGTSAGAKWCWASSFRGSSNNVLPEMRTDRKASARAAPIRSHQETAEVAVSRTACPAVKPEVDVSTFESLDIRVGLITDAKAVADPEMSAKRGVPTMSRKHLQLTVDIGCEERIVVSECKYVMDVEDAVGKKVLFVANVPPCEVLGITSHGMLLTGFNYDPTPMPRSFKVILPGLGRLPPGSEVKGAGIPK